MCVGGEVGWGAVGVGVNLGLCSLTEVHFQPQNLFLKFLERRFGAYKTVLILLKERSSYRKMIDYRDVTGRVLLTFVFSPSCLGN